MGFVLSRWKGGSIAGDDFAGGEAEGDGDGDDQRAGVLCVECCRAGVGCWRE